MAGYNSTIQALFGGGKFEPKAGEVGIEVEMEGKNIYHAPIPPYWRHDKDGSLRGDCAEFILRSPIPRDKVNEALDLLFKTLEVNNTKLRKDSPNTSVHVHLNVQKWTLKQVCNFICVWYILEELLVGWCGEDRTGNVFCLRGADAEAVLFRLSNALKYGNYMKLGDQNGLRYAALNYTSLSKFGSLEVRSLAGVYDKDVIKTWIDILLDIKDFSEKFESPSDVIKEYSQAGAGEFLKMACPRWHGLIKTKDFRDQMHEGMRLIQGVAYCVNWEKAKKKEEVLVDQGLQNLNLAPPNGQPRDVDWNPAGDRIRVNEVRIVDPRIRDDMRFNEEMARMGRDPNGRPLPPRPLEVAAMAAKPMWGLEPDEEDHDNNGDD